MICKCTISTYILNVKISVIILNLKKLFSPILYYTGSLGYISYVFIDSQNLYSFTKKKSHQWRKHIYSNLWWCYRKTNFLFKLRGEMPVKFNLCSWECERKICLSEFIPSICYISNIYCSTKKNSYSTRIQILNNLFWCCGLINFLFKLRGGRSIKL